MFAFYQLVKNAKERPEGLEDIPIFLLGDELTVTFMD
jgi:hypothetical protein